VAQGDAGCRGQGQLLGSVVGETEAVQLGEVAHAGSSSAGAERSLNLNWISDCLNDVRGGNRVEVHEDGAAGLAHGGLGGQTLAIDRDRLGARRPQPVHDGLHVAVEHTVVRRGIRRVVQHDPQPRTLDGDRAGQELGDGESGCQHVTRPARRQEPVTEQVGALPQIGESSLEHGDGVPTRLDPVEEHVTRAGRRGCVLMRLDAGHHDDQRGGEDTCGGEQGSRPGRPSRVRRVAPGRGGSVRRVQRL
jgi:hypothetical protein